MFFRSWRGRAKNVALDHSDKVLIRQWFVCTRISKFQNCRRTLDNYDGQLAKATKIWWHHGAFQDKLIVETVPLLVHPRRQFDERAFLVYIFPPRQEQQTRVLADAKTAKNFRTASVIPMLAHAMTTVSGRWSRWYRRHNSFLAVYTRRNLPILKRSGTARDIRTQATVVALRQAHGKVNSHQNSHSDALPHHGGTGETETI